jgi:ATP-dependent DNA helicase RecG
MRLEEIEVPVTNISGVGEAKAVALANLGINTVGDLLAHYPRDYDDRTQTVGLAVAQAAGALGARVHCKVRVVGHAWFGKGAPLKRR